MSDPEGDVDQYKIFEKAITVWKETEKEERKYWNQKEVQDFVLSNETVISSKDLAEQLKEGGEKEKKSECSLEETKKQSSQLSKSDHRALFGTASIQRWAGGGGEGGGCYRIPKNLHKFA